MAKPTPSKKKRVIYLAYNDYDDFWDVYYRKSDLNGLAFYIEVTVPENPRNKRSPAKIGEFEVEILEAV